MADPLETHRDPLAGLRAEMFKHTRYPGMDALVAVITKEQEASPEVKQAVDDAGEGRWYALILARTSILTYFTSRKTRGTMCIAMAATPPSTRVFLVG
jgi:hypothetical protein